MCSVESSDHAISKPKKDKTAEFYMYSIKQVHKYVCRVLEKIRIGTWGNQKCTSQNTAFTIFFKFAIYSLFLDAFSNLI